jgi:hypothetical protein
MEQPKDFAQEESVMPKMVTMEEWVQEQYEEANLFAKITYRLQDHVWKVILTGAVGGYLAGTHFGVFW